MTDDFCELRFNQFEVSLNRICADHDTAVKFWAAHHAEIERLQGERPPGEHLINGVMRDFTIKWANENLPRAGAA
jgi:hypothetical protein